MNLQIENKTALITGSTKGIGFAIARLLAEEGANVIVNGRNEASVEDADALAVMTALPQLSDVDWRALRPARRLVIDGCMGVDRRAAEDAGWTYRGLAGA